MIAAIVLAAGASSRMGCPKAALPLGRRGETVLSRGVSSLRAAGVPRVVVVAGAHPRDVRDALLAREPGVTVVDHRRWTEGQLSSLVCGLDAVDELSVEAVLVALVDVPLATADTVRRLVRAWRESGAPIVRPAMGEAHGHPVLFDRRLFAELRAADPAAGAKAVVRRHAGAVLNVPVTDEGAFLDLDVPADHQRALALAAERDAAGPAASTSAASP